MRRQGRRVEHLRLPYDPADWERLREVLTVERVRYEATFGPGW
jgi:hypothetical protein